MKFVALHIPLILGVKVLHRETLSLMAHYVLLITIKQGIIFAAFGF